MKPLPIRAGHQHPRAALKPEQVADCRKRYRDEDHFDYEEVARELYCSRSTVYRAVKRITYR